MGLIWSIIVGGFIGALAKKISKNKEPRGLLGNVIIGLIGSTLGQSIFRSFGPTIGGMALIPSILGAVIVLYVMNWLKNR